MTQHLTPSTAPVPPGLVQPDNSVTLSAVLSLTEGPAVDREGNVYFSDIPRSRIMKLSASGELGVFRENSGQANGNMFDRNGRLVTCEGEEFGPGGGRRVVRTDVETGEITVLTDRFEGRRYNSPNDLCIDTRGIIYFTDPRYADQTGREMDVEAVYRIDTDGGVKRILSQPEIQKPNGIAITPDDKTLYIVDSNGTVAGGNQKIWAFTLDDDGKPSDRRLVYDFAPGRGGDGIRLDRTGNLWIAAGVNAKREGRPGETLDVPTGVYVVTPNGELLGRIPIPEDILTNLTFGPPDDKTLYVTSGRNLYRIPLEVSGYVLR